MLDELLERAGLKFEDLNQSERETLNTWMNALSKSAVTLDRVKLYIASMRESVEQELTKTTHNSKQDIFLKARLRNYMLLDAFLTTPEKAKQQLDQAISSLVGGSA